MKKIIISFFMLFIFSPLVCAQTWNLDGVRTSKRAMAEIIQINEYEQTIQLKVVTRKTTGEYVYATCSIGDFTKIKGKDGKEIMFDELEVGDKVYVEASIFRTARRECQYIEVVDD